MDGDTSHFKYIIVGGGIAGAITFHRFAKMGKSLLLTETLPEDRKQPYENAKIICKHTFNWMSEAPWENSTIFPREHRRALYKSRDHAGLVEGSEFETILGKIVNLPYLIEWYISEGQKSGGIVQSKCKVLAIDNSVHLDHCVVSLSTNEYVTGKLVILATGSSDFTLQTLLGLPQPQTFNSISTSFSAPQEILDVNLPSDYMFQLHPQISKTGMLWMTRANDFFNIGFVSDEPEAVMREKFIRILQKYAPIQGFFQNVTPKVCNVQEKDFIFQKTTKYPVKQVSTHRILVVGDAAGLLYPLYLEGIVGAAVSTRLAAELIQKLDQSEEEYSKALLAQYNRKLTEVYINTYQAAGIRGDSLFFHANDHPIFTVWDAYVQVIHNNAKVRKNIVTAFTCEDLPNYPIENDYWCGEQIYHQLPIGKRLALTPIFLKQKFQQK